MKNNKRYIQAIILLSVLFTLSVAASAQKVKYNYLQGTDFSRYKTYSWVRIDGAQYPNQLLDQQIMQSIESQLSQKGLSKGEPGKSDLAFVYQVALNQEKEWSSYSTGGDNWGYGGWRGWGGGMGGMQTTHGSTSTITVGTLNLDVYDVQTKKQIWRGEATKTLDPPKDASKLQAKIDKAMAKLLKNYPPPAKK
ncbi:MAG: DUF4136 domain-containing protein [Pyrinomonadaceae bacterium]